MSSPLSRSNEQAPLNRSEKKAQKEAAKHENKIATATIISGLAAIAFLALGATLVVFGVLSCIAGTLPPLSPLFFFGGISFAMGVMFTKWAYTGYKQLNNSN